jgi:hypothetical protein
MEKSIRAIYIWDVRFPDVPVFELDAETQKFEMVGDPEFSYDIRTVVADDNWIIFSVSDEQVEKITITDQNI